MYKLSEFKGKSNNLSFIKFLAAVLVIYHHSYGLLSEGGSWLGGFAVAIFLFSSGFFVTKSMLRKKDMKSYAVGRFARLYPLFAFVILAAAFILGPIVTSCSLKDYFTNRETYMYLLFLLFIPRYSLPGVFKTSKLTLVNGALWTMILETGCYIGLGIGYKLKLLEPKVLKILNIPFLLGVLFLFGYQPAFFTYGAYVRPLCAFIIGVDFFVFKDEIVFDWKRICIFVLAGVAMVLLGRGSLAMILVLPYLLSAIVFAPKQLPDMLGKLGTYSYAMYLVAFPIQQVFSQYLESRSFLLNATLSTVTAFALAVVLYHLIEKPCGEKIIKTLE